MFAWSTFVGHFYYTNLSLFIKVQKRIGIARRKWTKINVHFSKGSRDFVQMALRKTRSEHNDVNTKILMKIATAYFFKCFMVKGFRTKMFSHYILMATNEFSSDCSTQYICSICNYNTERNSQYIRHLMTAKHIRLTNTNENVPKGSIAYMCLCGNEYKHASSLCKHKRTCKGTANAITSEIDTSNDGMSVSIKDNLIIELLKQNQEFKDLMIEQNKQMMELAKNAGHNTINNNNTNCNNKFNLNVFLNETCKDAITMDDFINSIEVTREDFLHTGQVGFVEGISTVMAHRFRDMEMHTRPLHCTDLKRETIYIKNADKWEKDDSDKTQMRKAVRSVAKKNMKELWRWYNDNKPAVEQIGTDVCEDYFKYHKSALGGYGKEEDLKFEEKIIKNVIKEVQVDKTALTAL